MNFIHWLLRSSFVQAFFTKEVRHLATAAAGFILAYLQAHHAHDSDAQNIAEGIGSIIIGLGGYGLSMLNASGAQAQVAAAAQTGIVMHPAQAQALIQQCVVAQQKADTAQTAAVQKIISQADSTAPETKAALLVDLAAGGPK